MTTATRPATSNRLADRKCERGLLCWFEVMFTVSFRMIDVAHDGGEEEKEEEWDGMGDEGGRKRVGWLLGRFDVIEGKRSEMTDLFAVRAVYSEQV